MDDTRMRSRRRAIWLAWGAIGGVVVFNLGWLLAGALQGDGYSVAGHDVSDLGALTARSPWVMLTAQVIAGTLIIAFALFALGPALAVPGRGPAPGSWRHPSLVSTTSPTPSSGSTAAQPTRAAPPRPPPAPGTAKCTSRSVCSAPSPWSRPHSSSPPGCVRRMAGVTWPGRRSSLARCCSSSCSATRRSNERRAVATCNGRRSCWCRWASRRLRSASVPWRGHATSCSSADTGGLAIRAGSGVTRDHPRWNGASGTPPAWRWMGGQGIRP